MFKIGEFNIDSYKPESKGVRLAKDIMLWSNIILLYGAAMLFLFIFWTWKTTYLFQIPLCKDTGVIYIALAIMVFVMGIWFAARSAIIRKAKKLPTEERFDYNLYLLHKMYARRKRLKNLNLIILAKCLATMGNKELCKQALDEVSPDYRSKDLDELRAWTTVENYVLDESVLTPAKVIHPIRILFIFWIIAYGFLYDSIAFYDGIEYIFNSRFAVAVCAYISVFSCTLFATLVFSICLNLFNKRFNGGKKTTKLQKIVLIILVGIIALYWMIQRSDAIEYGLGKDNYYYEDYSYDNDDYYDYSEDYTYAEEPAVEDIDIMNEMIVLCNYLKNDGIIPDFSVKLDYSAKGNVKGTVAQDDDYIYVLYDNGIKEDDIGNECIELVLEAEPLDENGNSLGQTEAKLKGFYLVNLETDEVIDEHKTSW